MPSFSASSEIDAYFARLQHPLPAERTRQRLYQRVIHSTRQRDARRQLHLLPTAALDNAERNVERHRLRDRRLAGHAASPNAACQHLAREAAEAIDTEPDVEPIRAEIDALDQQRHDARLLGGEEFVPQRIELLQSGAGVGLGDVVGMGAPPSTCLPRFLAGGKPRATGR